VKGAGFSDYIIGGQLVYFQGIRLSLEFGEFGRERPFLVFKGSVELPEFFRGYLVSLVELMGLPHCAELVVRDSTSATVV